MTIVDLLKANAEKYPQDTALIEVDPDLHTRREIDWQTFNLQTNQVANYLTQKGVKKNDKVAMLMHNSLEWLPIYFGIMKTGAWVVPLNFRFIAVDVEYCLSISEANIIFIDPEYMRMVDELKNKVSPTLHVIVVGQNTSPEYIYLKDIFASSPASEPEILLLETEDCGLYFTSGTTGAPKPILLTHHNMISSAIIEQKHHEQVKEDNFVLIPPLYHAGAKMHWFGNLLVGAKATLLKKVSPQYILDTMQEEEATIVWLLVPWAHDILEALDKGELDLSRYNLNRWRLMHIGAQPVPPSLVQRWQSYFPDMQYDNNFGLSESTGPGCVHLGMENKHRIDCNGKAGYMWQAAVVREDGSNVNPGEVGELVVKGPGVMREYYRNPQKTAETIINGWLHTGDMAKIDDEGFIYIVDRKKDIVITGGENIFPVEIEDELHKHPRIHDVAIIGLPDDRLVEVVAAVVQPKENMEISKEEIFEFCSKTLPRYKWPRVIIFDQVPRNPTGKIEKIKLRAKYANCSFL
ncbi:MAG TPA: class I adenylate-forming enzyme family protein [Dehalococcoidia bacterium]|nr:class I adenylate-forming enzyme family protein [Dehalococcoidia bacterium]